MVKIIKISKKKNSKFINVEYSQNNFFNQLLNIVVVFNMFFRAIENFAFYNLIQMLKSNVKFFKRIKFVKFIDKKQNVVKHTLFWNLKFDTKINITLNNWWSSNNLKFIKITVYFINLIWKDRESYLIFWFLLDNHTKKFMIRKMIKIFKKYKLKRRLFAIIINNVNNNYKMRKNIKIFLKTKNII